MPRLPGREGATPSLGRERSDLGRRAVGSPKVLGRAVSVDNPSLPVEGR